jgi:hypothetical protein
MLWCPPSQHNAGTNVDCRLCGLRKRPSDVSAQANWFAGRYRERYSFFKKKLCQIRSVLSGDTRDEDYRGDGSCHRRSIRIIASALVY